MLLFPPATARRNFCESATDCLICYLLLQICIRQPLFSLYVLTGLESLLSSLSALSFCLPRADGQQLSLQPFLLVQLQLIFAKTLPLHSPLSSATFQQHITLRSSYCYLRRYANVVRYGMPLASSAKQKSSLSASSATGVYCSPLS